MGRNEPDIPRVATNIPLGTAHGSCPTAQVKHRDEDLLARDDRHISVLIVIDVLVLGHDVVDPGVNVAIERATRLNRPYIAAVPLRIIASAARLTFLRNVKLEAVVFIVFSY